jgi:hypothetical protein
MDNAARTRQRVLAIFLPVTAVLYIGGEALSPKGTDQVIATTATALKVLPIAARHPAQLGQCHKTLQAAGAVCCLGSVRAGKPASEVCASSSVIPKAMNM